MRNAVPFLHASPAAAGCGVLGDEDRVAAKRRLFAVIGDDRRGKALGDEILGVGKHHGQAFAAQVGELLAAQVEAAAKSGFGKRGKYFVQVSHITLELLRKQDAGANGLARFHVAVSLCGIF